MTRPFFVFVLGGLSMLVLAGCASHTAIPATPRETMHETIHGQAVADPYRWLEGPAPDDHSAAADELRNRVNAWTQAQNDRTRQWLGDSPWRKPWQQRLHSLFDIETRSAPVVRGNYEFSRVRQPGKPQSLLFVRDCRTGQERLLFDPSQLDPSGRTTLDWTAPSQDGSLVALGMFANGDEKTELRLLRTRDGKLLDDHLTGRVKGASWMPDGHSFVYGRLLEENNPHSGAICHHVVGQPMAADRIVMKAVTTGPLAKGGGPSGSLSRDGQHLIISDGLRRDQNDLSIADWPLCLATGELRSVPILAGLKAGGDLDLRGDQAYLLTDDGAPNNRLFLIDLKTPDRANWRELIPEDAGAVLQNVQLTRHYLLATWRKAGCTVMEKRDLQGKRLATLPLPGAGSAAATVSEESDVIHLDYTSHLTPRSVYRLDLDTLEIKKTFTPKLDADLSRFEAIGIEVLSTGGAKVPLTILRRKGLPQNGTAPAVLRGYGGFAISQDPAFSSSYLPWLEAGGVLAIAGLRGGSERGNTWHLDGMQANKQHTFDDCIACLEHLAQAGYADRKRLAIWGGSNGGLLTAAVTVQRPDLVGAAISDVPLTDMIRFPRFLMGQYWISEYGDPAKAEDFAWLYAYSPYHRIRPGMNYPPMLVRAGENDLRVHPCHARKFAARMQNDTAPGSGPVWFYSETQSGHGGGMSLDLAIEHTLDAWIFLAKSLGVTKGK
jgi:prolyl oligopeptidase